MHLPRPVSRWLILCAVAFGLLFHASQPAYAARSKGRSSSGDVSVKGHYRNGKWVNGYKRSRPDGINDNNWSTQGNVNPYTGKAGTKKRKGDLGGSRSLFDSFSGGDDLSSLDELLLGSGYEPVIKAAPKEPARTPGQAINNNFVGGSLSGRDFSNGGLLDASFVGATLRGANFSGTLLRAADFRRARLSGAKFTGAKLVGADFRDAAAPEASFQDAQMRAADLRRCELFRADLRGADLDGADLRNACLLGADLSTAALEGARLGGALYDEATKWPAGFDPVKAGAVKTSDASLPLPTAKP